MLKDITKAVADALGPQGLGGKDKAMEAVGKETVLARHRH